jgi:ABC-type molybdate transport system substrate-binding protein
VEKNVVFRAGCVPELANALKLKTIDAAILWDATAFQSRKDVDTIEIPAEWSEVAVVPIGVLRCARNVEAARQFMEFVASAEAQAIFRVHGYTTEKPAGLVVPSL